MATAQLLHAGQSHNTSKETALFPNKVATEQQSMALVKRLLAISISCITYLRGLFPESSYGTRYLDDMCLRILREDRSCQGSMQIVKWIRGCFDALEKNYLHMAVLAIFTNPKEPERLTELYRFKFKYSKNGPLMDFASTQVNFANGMNSEEIKKASILLVRKLYVLMQNLGPLPNDITLTMKLFYYNDVTPNDYQPPGFKEGSAPDCLTFDGDPVNLKVGTVSTRFHVLKVRVTTESKRMGMLESSLAEENGSAEISHQGLDCDEEEEEGSTKTEEQNKLQATDMKLDKSRTWKGDAVSGRKDILSLNPKGKETTGKSVAQDAERGPLAKTSRQTCRLDLACSQEEVGGLLKRSKVSEPVHLISGPQK